MMSFLAIYKINNYNLLRISSCKLCRSSLKMLKCLRTFQVHTISNYVSLKSYIKPIAILLLLLDPYAVHIECNYPTYYDSVSAQCVTTCPQGTIGNVSRSDNTTTRNCTSREFYNPQDIQIVTKTQ